jgi:hypothetical protein
MPFTAVIPFLRPPKGGVGTGIWNRFWRIVRIDSESWNRRAIPYPRQHYVGVMASPSCPKCQTSELDEDWGSHGDDCPDGDHRHLVCTNPECFWAFTVISGPGRHNEDEGGLTKFLGSVPAKGQWPVRPRLVSLTGHGKRAGY